MAEATRIADNALEHTVRGPAPGSDPAPSSASSGTELLAWGKSALSTKKKIWQRRPRSWLGPSTLATAPASLGTALLVRGKSALNCSVFHNKDLSSGAPRQPRRRALPTLKGSSSLVLQGSPRCRAPRRGGWRAPPAPPSALRARQVRTVLAALTAPELLKSTRGAMVWHGRDLRRYRRLLSPPLQRLLSCPGAPAPPRPAVPARRPRPTPGPAAPGRVLPQAPTLAPNSLVLPEWLAVHRHSIAGSTCKGGLHKPETASQAPPQGTTIPPLPRWQPIDLSSLVRARGVPAQARPRWAAARRRCRRRRRAAWARRARSRTSPATPCAPRPSRRSWRPLGRARRRCCAACRCRRRSGAPRVRARLYTRPAQCAHDSLRHKWCCCSRACGGSCSGANLRRPSVGGWRCRHGGPQLQRSVDGSRDARGADQHSKVAHPYR